MPPLLALGLCFIFILWLLLRDQELRPMTSGALWIALIWVAIVGSRPISLWFNAERYMQGPEDYFDGSPLDRNIFIILILAALYVLWGRRIQLRNVFTSNRWFFVFFLYCGISVIWSDFPFISFKRFFKDVGHVSVVLIIATETDPVRAARAVFARYAALVLPLSVTLIKYFPDFGRYYNRWTYLPGYSGVTTNKNELGVLACICGLFLVWELIELFARPDGAVRGTGIPALAHRGSAFKPNALSNGRSQTRPPAQIGVEPLDLLARMVLLLTALWIIIEAQSSTAQTCFVLGTTILLFMQLPIVRQQFRSLGTYTVVFSVVGLILYAFPEILGPIVSQMGKDLTLSGRTDLWEYLLIAPINPILGAGYQSFWLGDYAVQLWDKYYFHPVQAHNGYLETYLQGGLVGLSLLIATVLTTGRGLKQAIVRGDTYANLRFTFLFVAVLYNWTEALFNKLSPIWIILLLAALTCAREVIPEKELVHTPNRRLLVTSSGRRVPA